MGGPNLEVFKFGMYIAFPIAWMYYFGTNLDERFKVPDFWPTAAHSNKIPTEPEEREELRQHLRDRREAAMRQLESRKGARGGVLGEVEKLNVKSEDVIPAMLVAEPVAPPLEDVAKGRSWSWR